MDHTRHIGIFSAQNYSATLIGAGGIGALTALVLAKMGIGALIVYDGDKVDDVNIPVQFHKLSDVGMAKCYAIEKAINEYADDISFEPVHERVVLGTELNPTHLIISAVDSIQARKDIWEAVKVANPLWYLDARMSAEHFQMFAVDMNDTRWYEDSLAGQADSQIPDEPCTSKATIYTSAIAAGQIGSAVRRIVTDHQDPGILSHDIFRDQLSTLSMHIKADRHIG